MMYGYGQMFGWGCGLFGTFGILTWAVWLIVGILLAVFLWKKVSKEQ